MTSAVWAWSVAIHSRDIICDVKLLFWLRAPEGVDGDPGGVDEAERGPGGDAADGSCLVAPWEEGTGGAPHIFIE